MQIEYTTLQHFYSLDDAERARVYLEECGWGPLILEEARNGSGVYALQVPESALEEAERLLDEMPPSEEEEAMETLNEWEKESDEAREAFEQK